MKFKVRPGFVVHDRKVVEIGGQTQIQESSYFEGQEVDFDAETADQHAHKLEPVCKAATSYLAAKHPEPAAPAAGLINTPEFQQAVAAAVAAALAQQTAAS